ncbi:MAG: hypothetical protein ACLGHN_10195 [Bacteriovoracia bacterium]
MTTKERTFKNILINPSFQLKLLSYFIIMFLVSTLSLYSTTYLFFWNMKQKGLKVGIPDGHVYYQFLQNQKHDLDLLFIGLAAINFFLLLFVGFIISHRIAGPLYKIKQFLENPDKEEKVTLREKDFFKELEPLLNELKENKK